MRQYPLPTPGMPSMGIGDCMKIGVLVLIVALLGVAIWWEVYKYQDCKMVGHSTLYCIGKLGK